MALLYGTFIFLFWKITGRIQYSFLDFNCGYTAFWHILGINVGATMAYFALAAIDDIIKPKLYSSSSYNEDDDDVELRKYGFQHPFDESSSLLLDEDE